MVKIQQGYKHRNFLCKRCPAFFNKQAHLDAHMEIVHKVVLDATPARQCLLCGGPIIGRVSNAKFCSSKCSGKFHHLKSKT